MCGTAENLCDTAIAPALWHTGGVFKLRNNEILPEGENKQFLMQLMRLNKEERKGDKMGMTDLSEFVDKLGEKLVDCKPRCAGIDKNVPPRGLYPENPEHRNKFDCIIVGQNPGSANRKEKEEYKKHKTYSATKICAQNSIEQPNPIRYYKWAKKFAEQLGWGESILWTEICKCQSIIETTKGKKRKKQIPLQTFRTCIKKFLEKELAKFPDTPIIALGQEAFVAVSYRFPDRFVVGVPHPKGARGKKFLSLFENDRLENLKDNYKKEILQAKRINACIRVFPKAE
jgi:hypothetical protein